MNIEIARKYIVIVNGGSGCIIQPMTDEYLYVLTAKHNIIDSNNQLASLVRFSYENNTWSSINVPINAFVEGQDYFLHPNKDVAIIKIPFLEGFNDTYRFDSITEEKNEYYLLGYPEIRRNNQPYNTEWYRLDFGIQILDSRNGGMYEAQIPGNATLNEVRGDSGGAILKVVHNKLYVVGIQNKMAEEEEQLGRVRFSQISSFDEIVALNSQHLQPILPFYLKSFSFLEADIFNLEYGLLTQAKCEKLTEILKAKASALKESNLVPNVIREFIKEKLPLTHHTEGYENCEKKIWALWLELFTILNIAKSKAHTIDDLPNIFKKARLFYSNTDKDYWQVHLRDLLSKDYSGLDDNGIVIVASNKKAEDDLHILDVSKIPGSIFQTLEKEHDLRGLRTDVATDFPLQKYKFANISAFKEGVAQQVEDSFIADQVSNCITVLKELYERLIPN